MLMVSSYIYLLSEISQGDAPTLKRKYDGDHDNENGVDSPSNLTNELESVNGGNDDDSTPVQPLPSREVSLQIKLDYMKNLWIKLLWYYRYIHVIICRCQ